MNQLLTDAARIVSQLNAVIADVNADRRVIEVAALRRSTIENGRDSILRKDYKIAFVGQIGIGKSSLIGLTCGLVLGDSLPEDRKSLGSNSVLAVGSGGTTVCEVRIKNAPSEHDAEVGLEIEPLTIEEMRREILFFAADEWARRQSSASEAAESDAEEPTPREVRRVIRSMTGLVERFERTEGGAKQKFDPLDDVVATSGNQVDFGRTLVEKANLLSRERTEWWWPSDGQELRNAKVRFDEINHGRDASAMLPKKITIYLPKVLPQVSGDLELEIVDTRGFDSRLAGRRDIQQMVRDERSLVVVCVPFKEAPGEQVKGLLRDMLADASLRSAVPRTQLLLMDHGDAEGVNGANGDRETGQALKLDECARALETVGLGEFLEGSGLASHDCLKDPVSAAQRLIVGRILAIRSAAVADLRANIADSSDFLSNLEDERKSLAQMEVDRRLSLSFRGNAPEGLPMRDPLEGLYDAISEARYASQVLATLRRAGIYYALDAYAAIRSGAAQRATRWIRPTHAAVMGEINALACDEELQFIAGHVRLRRGQIESGIVDSVVTYASGVHDQVAGPLRNDDVWDRCAAEWGRGRGFKDRVIAHLMEWSRANSMLETAGTKRQPQLSQITGALEGPH